MIFILFVLGFPLTGVNSEKANVHPKRTIVMPTIPFELKLPKQWNILLEEHFETGIPSDWTVVNSNGDGVHWTTGTTYALSNPPPDYETAYAFYSDDAAGEGAPPSQPGEDIITPPVFTSGMDTIRVIFAYGNSWAYDYDDTFGVWVRQFTGGSWTEWVNVANYPNETSGYDTLEYTGVIDSIQVMWRYSDNGGWNYAVGIDNVYILGHLQPVDHDVGTISISSPPNFYTLNTNYNLTATFQNTGLNTEVFNAYYETYDEDMNQVHYYEAPNITLDSGDTIRIDFASGSTFNHKKLLLRAWTYLSSDQRTFNDTLEKWIYADIDGYSFNSSPTPTPPIYAKPNVSYELIEQFSNNGAVGDTFDIYIIVTLNGSTIFEDSLEDFYIGGATGYEHNWGNIVFPEEGNYTITQVITSPYDIRNGNDTLVINGFVSKWEFFVNMPIPLSDHSVVTDGSKIYVIGGYDGSSTFDSLWIWDFVGGWTRGANLPADLCMGDACILGDTIYFAGGYSYSADTLIDSLYKYSISGDNWTVSPGTGEPCVYYTLKPANGKIYKIGGYNPIIDEGYASTWEYDPSTGSWTKKADMPFACALMLSDVKNDTIYLIGGDDGTNTRNETRFYDAVNDNWTMDSSVFAYYPIGIYGGGCSFYKDTLFVISGMNGDWELTDSVFFYDRASNTWILDGCVTRPVYRTDAVGFENGKGANDGIYLFGGVIESGWIDSVFVRKQVVTGIPEERKAGVKFTSRIGSRIEFVISGKGSYNVSIFDVTGRRVKEINSVLAGRPVTIAGNDVKNGVYFVKISGIDKPFKIILLK